MQKSDALLSNERARTDLQAQALCRDEATTLMEAANSISGEDSDHGR
jgi:hypothetical protein